MNGKFSQLGNQSNRKAPFHPTLLMEKCPQPSPKTWTNEWLCATCSESHWVQAISDLVSFLDSEGRVHPVSQQNRTQLHLRHRPNSLVYQRRWNSLYKAYFLVLICSKDIWEQMGQTQWILYNFFGAQNLTRTAHVISALPDPEPLPWFSPKSKCTPDPDQIHFLSLSLFKTVYRCHLSLYFQ